MKSLLETSKISSFFTARQGRVFGASEVIEAAIEHRDEWKVPGSISWPKLIDRLLRTTELREIRLNSATYRPIIRYAWGSDVSPLRLALSTARDTFFTHASAMWIHEVGGLGNDLFVNHEQSPKPNRETSLTQEAIDRAFRHPQRQTKMIYTHAQFKITILNGKNTGRLDVVKKTAPTGEEVEVTSLERTLVDLAVRPAYAGGFLSVLEAYQSCRGHISAEKLAQVLQKMDYRYPYAQAVGFLLQRAGYSTDEQSHFKRLATNFKFYVSYGMHDPLFDQEWSVFYPRGIH